MWNCCHNQLGNAPETLAQKGIRKDLPQTLVLSNTLSHPSKGRSANRVCLLPLEAGGHPGNRTWLHRDASIDGASAERSPGRWAARASGSSRANSNTSACHLPVKDGENDSFAPRVVPLTA